MKIEHYLFAVIGRVAFIAVASFIFAGFAGWHPAGFNRPSTFSEMLPSMAVWVAGIAFSIWLVDRLDEERFAFRFLGVCAYAGGMLCFVIVSAHLAGLHWIVCAAMSAVAWLAYHIVTGHMMNAQEEVSDHA